MTFVRGTLEQAKPSVRKLIKSVRQIIATGEHLPTLLELGKPYGYKNAQSVHHALFYWLEEVEMVQLIEIRIRQSRERKAMAIAEKRYHQCDRQAAIATKIQTYGSDHFREHGRAGGLAKGNSLNINHPRRA